MININEIIIDISDIEIMNDSETINEEEIYGNEYISINGKISRTDMKMADSVDNNIRIKIINDIIYSGRIHSSIN
jgi:hypothetical protein